LITSAEAWTEYSTALAQNPKAFAELKKLADSALALKPLSVVGKSIPAASGDPHDYFSMGPYWWPNPDSANGLPYIRKDGQPNPDSRNTDRPKLDELTQSVATLILFASEADSLPHAEKAAALVRAWFLDPATRMNPNLNYAQAIPGRTDGRGIGIIDTHSLIYLLDQLAHLPPTAWTAEDDQGLKQWFTAFVNWLLTSPNGRTENGEHNNHGTWYDAQVVAFSLYADQPDIARERIQTITRKRLCEQVELDGRQPHEIARTLSLSYSTFNLLAFVSLAQMGRHVGVDLWSDPETGSRLRAAIRFLLPYFRNPASWPHEQIKPFTSRAVEFLLAIARLADPLIAEAARDFPIAPWSYVALLEGAVRGKD